MILNGLFGLKFSEQSLSFAPYLPPYIHAIEMKNLKYRRSILDISIKGNGKSIRKFTVDGKEQVNHSINLALKGKHNISVELE
jgi:cellobiose phosphorylase